MRALRAALGAGALPRGPSTRRVAHLVALLLALTARLGVAAPANQPCRHNERQAACAGKFARRQRQALQKALRRARARRRGPGRSQLARHSAQGKCVLPSAARGADGVVRISLPPADYERCYGRPPAPASSNLSALRLACLRAWHAYADTLGVDYSIAFGTLLDWRRAGRLHASTVEDMDAFVGRDGWERAARGAVAARTAAHTAAGRQVGGLFAVPLPSHLHPGLERARLVYYHLPAAEDERRRSGLVGKVVCDAGPRVAAHIDLYWACPAARPFQSRPRACRDGKLWLPEGAPATCCRDGAPWSARVPPTALCEIHGAANVRCPASLAQAEDELAGYFGVDWRTPRLDDPSSRTCSDALFARFDRDGDRILGLSELRALELATRGGTSSRALRGTTLAHAEGRGVSRDGLWQLYSNSSALPAANLTLRRGALTTSPLGWELRNPVRDWSVAANWTRDWLRQSPCGA